MNDTRPDPTVKLLRELRSATRQCILAYDAGLAVLTEDFTAGNPELVYVRSALRVATGARGSGYSFGTPSGIERMLSKALGEST